MLEEQLTAMKLRAEAAEAEKAKVADGLRRKGQEQEEANDAALQALAEKRCVLHAHFCSQSRASDVVLVHAV